MESEVRTVRKVKCKHYFKLDGQFIKITAHWYYEAVKMRIC